MIRFTVPIHTPSASNLREHWAIRARRIKIQRKATWLACIGAKGPIEVPDPPCVVELVRQSPRALDDDNLRGALKGIRDEVASILGVDDRDPRVEWRYGQSKGKAAVVIEIQEVGRVD